jgi:hypothetical protein
MTTVTQIVPEFVTRLLVLLNSDLFTFNETFENHSLVVGSDENRF